MAAAAAKVVVATELPSKGKGILQAALPEKDVWFWPETGGIPREELLARVKGAELLLVSLREKVDDELLEAAGPQLRGVSTLSVGYDHIDVPACASRGVAVGNTPGVLTETTADTAFALLIATARRVPEAVDAVKSGAWRDWRPEWMCGKDVWGSAVGIIGLGRIGLAFARRVAGFGCAVLYSGRSRKPDAEKELLARGAPSVEYVSQEDLLARADFVVPMCELNAETAGMFCAPVFRAMKSDAVLINITRGAVVNQDDLCDALSNGDIGAAGLDVTVPEPLPPDHRLLTLPNCVVFPHIGSASVGTRQRMSELAADNIVAALNGEAMPNLVT